MIEDRVREDIAFIRRAVEEGRTFATASSPDIMIWESRSPSVISAPTLSSGVGRPSIPAGRGPCASDCRGSIRCAVCCRLSSNPASTVRWLVPSRCCGSAAAFSSLPSRSRRSGAATSARAGSMPSSPASWDRLFRQCVAQQPRLAALGGAALVGRRTRRFALRHRPEFLPLSAALMLLLLAGPGLLLSRRRA